MKIVLGWISELLWPLWCLGCGAGGTRLCRSCLWDLPFPARMEYHPARHVDRLVWAGALRTPLLERAVWRLKYRNAADLGEPLGQWLARMALGVGLAGSNAVILPVPLHPSRLRSRGYNQAELLARPLATALSVVCTPEALSRTRRTGSQVESVGRRERLVNMAGAFSVPHPELVVGRRIILVDDVCTTGATLSACATALKEAGALVVDAVVLARG